MFQPGAEQIVATLIQKRVKAVSFGRGPDRAMILRFKDAGIRCIPTVGALKHAHKMAALGVDALVVQGGEGGGHTGSVPSTILLPQVLDAVKLPVVAAGGFADGRGLVAALAFGAQGIAMGTRFLMTRDCPVPESTKRRYVLATTDDILVTKRVDGIPQRMIRNETLAGLESANGLSRLLRAVRGASDMKRHTGATWRQMFELLLAQRRGSELSFSQSLYAGIAPALFERAMVGGLPETGLLATGLVAGRLDTLPSCSELLTEIMQDARTRIDALNGSTK
jgi:NAD(P)H-dependent flavin oxidoreductase YrpB (nitropropane dioxygenase family)